MVTWNEIYEDGRYPQVITQMISDALIPLLPEPPLTLLDYGCGRGELTFQCAEAGYEVVGLDTSTVAIGIAQTTYPDLDFRITDQIDDTYDVTVASLVYAYMDMPDSLNRLLSHTRLAHFALVQDYRLEDTGNPLIPMAYFNEEDMAPPLGWNLEIIQPFSNIPYVFLAHYTV